MAKVKEEDENNNGVTKCMMERRRWCKEIKIIRKKKCVRREERKNV